jgi:hypothetical protein
MRIRGTKNAQALKTMLKISPNYSIDKLRDAVMTHAPWQEDIRTSLERLSRAILADGGWCVFSAASVWWAYNRHPCLGLTEQEAMRRWKAKEPPFGKEYRKTLRERFLKAREERRRAMRQL